MGAWGIGHERRAKRPYGALLRIRTSNRSLGIRALFLIRLSCQRSSRPAWRALRSSSSSLRRFGADPGVTVGVICPSEHSACSRGRLVKILKKASMRRCPNIWGIGAMPGPPCTPIANIKITRGAFELSRPWPVVAHHEPLGPGWGRRRPRDEP